MGSIEIEVLVSRLRWPVPAVKWWTGQQLALLLLNPTKRGVVESLLIRALAGALFEIQAVEILLIFWLARVRDHAFSIPSELGGHVQARSPLSDLVLESLEPGRQSFGTYQAPPMLLPAGVVHPPEFVAAEGRDFPRILRTVLRRFEDCNGLPFQDQFASEWASSLGRVPDHRHRIEFFLESSAGESTGQFFTEQSARARSAFLRTLTVAKECWSAPPGIIEDAALQTLPLDPSLAWLQSHSPVDGLSLSQPGVAEPDVEHHIRDILARMSKAGAVGAASWPAMFENNVVWDIQVILWWGQEGNWPGNLDPEEAASVNVGMLQGSGLLTECSLDYTNLITRKQRPDGFRPLAGEALLGRFGYMQTDLVSRHIFAPVARQGGMTISAQPSGDTLSFFMNPEVGLGRFGYWNVQWRPSYPRDLAPQVATYLLLHLEGLQQGATEKTGHLFYAWRCRGVGRRGVGRFERHGVLPWGQL
jgi:hypothetical protein